MQRLILLALLSSLVAPVVARAESPTQLLCAPAEREWAKVKDGTDVAARARTIREIGPRCAAVLRATARLATVDKGARKPESISAPPHSRSPSDELVGFGTSGDVAFEFNMVVQPGFIDKESVASNEANVGWLYATGYHGYSDDLCGKNYPCTKFSVGQDYKKAMAYFRMSAAHGYNIAEYDIGVLYENGLGVPQDYAKAMSWYLKAATAPLGRYTCACAEAAYRIGVLYANGEGVPTDIAKARAWMVDAEAWGSDAAKAWLTAHNH